MPSYVEQLLDPRWQRKRLEVLSAAAWRCRRCQNSRRTLHVHHRKYRPVAAWEYPSAELDVLCAPCHVRSTDFCGEAQDSTKRLHTAERQFNRCLAAK